MNNLLPFYKRSAKIRFYSLFAKKDFIIFILLIISIIYKN